MTSNRKNQTRTHSQTQTDSVPRHRRAKNAALGPSLILFLLTQLSLPTLAQEFHFKFTFKDQTWSLSTEAQDWSKAIKIASHECLNHFTQSKGKQKVSVDEETARLLLNTCTNPR